MSTQVHAVAVPRHRLSRRGVMLTLGVGLGVAAIAAAAYALGLRINLTESMPVGLWHVDRGAAPVLGRAVFTCPPNTAITHQAQRQGYLPYGRCTGGFATVVKTVVAGPGDRIELAKDALIVIHRDGRRARYAGRLHRDSRGRLIPSIALGRYDVPAGTYWLGATYSPRSYDSRYFGPVNAQQIQGPAAPLWVAGGSSQ